MHKYNLWCFRRYCLVARVSETTVQAQVLAMRLNGNKLAHVVVKYLILSELAKVLENVIE